MMTRRTLHAAVVAVVLAALTAIANAQPAATDPKTAPLTAKIPVDSQITTDTLPNGIKYYVRKNRKPEARAELRLVVNAGSLMEEDDQQGLAHFVEHMAFNGTKNFPKNETIKFLESIGMRFGADVNAYTSFDETVYTLHVPTDKPDVLDKSFLILEDWAHNVTFDDAEVDKERGVITEEWRLRRGASARLQDKQFPILLKGSRYADRLPIGKMDVVQHFSHDRVRQFYKDWYRPDLMAVIAVGDFDKAAVETLIKNHFGPIPRPASVKPRPLYPIPDQPGTAYAVATDKEMTQTSVVVYRKLPLRDQTTIAGYRQQIVERLFAGMLSARFAEITQKPDAPFLGASGGRGNFFRTKDASTLSALVKEGGAERGLEALYTEGERVARFGYVESEIVRIKRNTLRALEQAVAEKANTPSDGLADELVRNFTDQEPAPGIDYEYALYQRFLPEITIAEVNALAKDWVPDGNRVVVVSAPEKDGVAPPDESKLESAIASAARADLKPYSDTSATGALLENVPAAGSVTKTTTKESFGITEWELSNGVRVVMKPTKFKDDEIQMRAFSPGGSSLASDADFIPAATAADVVASGGLGKLNAVDLRKALAGKAAGVRPFIGELSEGLNGTASPKDLETLFQLVYLTFTAPRADAEVFGVRQAQRKAQLANQKASPEYAFAEALTSALTSDHPRRRLMTPEIVDRMSLEKSMAFYKDRFSDASDFTFVFVGSFEPATLKPLAEKYLATLPATHRQETWKDVGVPTPKGVVEKRVEKGIEPKSETAIVYSGPFDYTQQNRIVLRALTDVLETSLLETLREDLGGTYSVQVQPDMSKNPRGEYSVEIDFGSSPERPAELIKRVYAEIEAIKASGPTEKQVADVREKMVREYEETSKGNEFWLGNLSTRYEYGEDVSSLFVLPDLYRKLSPADIQAAAKKYLDPANHVTVTLFPEKK
jgi:zinc protease